MGGGWPEDVDLPRQDMMVVHKGKNKLLWSIFSIRTYQRVKDKLGAESPLFPSWQLVPTALRALRIEYLWIVYYVLEPMTRNEGNLKSWDSH